MTAPNQTRNNSPVASAALWASAFLLAALVIVQAGKLPGQAAYAGAGSSEGDFTLLTARSGRGGETDPDEVLFVIDNRSEMLYVYEIEDGNNGAIQLQDGGPLPNMFSNAR